MDENRKARLMALPGYVVLGREPQDNAYVGTVENSFSLGLSKDHVQFNWSSDAATSNFGGRFTVDGAALAARDKEYWEKQRPGMMFEVFDARDADKLPVVLDWEGWLAANEPADTLSGVRDKYRARNIRFEMKD
jgi:hypothetical protein